MKHSRCVMRYKDDKSPLMIYSLSARYARKKRMIYQAGGLDKQKENFW